MQKIFLLLFAISLTLGIGACRKKNGCTNKCAKNYNRAKNDDGSCQFVKPIIDYARYYPNSCKPPYGVYFSSNVTNVTCDTKYEWNFGDGITSTDQNPYHVFNASGSYTVLVKAINGIEEGTRQIVIQLDTLQPIVANFSYNAEKGSYRAPSIITFYNYSAFAGEFVWDFGDGTTSSLTNPTHTYTSGGNYTVLLRSKCGTRQATYSQSISIANEPGSIVFTRFKVYGGSQSLSKDKGTPLYVEMLYNNNSNLLSKIYLYKEYPATWYFPSDIDVGSYKVNDHFYTFDNFTFKLWLDELGLNDKVLNSVNVDYDYLRRNHYPTVLDWDQNGYHVEALVDYQ